MYKYLSKIFKSGKSGYNYSDISCIQELSYQNNPLKTKLFGLISLKQYIYCYYHPTFHVSLVDFTSYLSKHEQWSEGGLSF